MRRFTDFVADVRDGELVALAHKDLADRELDVPCSFCGHGFAPKRCDFRCKEKNGLTCDRRMCEACAVHLPAFNDTDFCVPHAREAGVVFDLVSERRAQAIERRIRGFQGVRT